MHMTVFSARVYMCAFWRRLICMCVYAYCICVDMHICAWLYFMHIVCISIVIICVYELMYTNMYVVCICLSALCMCIVYMCV